MLGDARFLPLKDESVDCVITSPRDNRGRFIKGFQYHPSTQFKKGEHWRTKGLHWDKEWLYQKYIIEKLSASEIAKIVRCKRNNILFWLDKHGIQKRNTSESRVVKHWGQEGEKNPMFGKRGIFHHNWHGGLTPFRQALYSKAEAKEWFKKIYSRDGRKCRLCFSVKKLEVHHIYPISRYPLLALDPRNGIVLCALCHNKTKGKESRFRNHFLKLILEAKGRVE